MRIRKVRISDFKNLKNFEMDFDNESPYVVLVGGNGAGKSNLLEALTLIFRNLDLEEPSPFSYEIWYECRGQELHVVGEFQELSRSFLCAKDGADVELRRREYMAEDELGRPRYRPAFVFGYYSGPSDRLSRLYERHRERFYNWIIKDRDRRTAVRDPNSLRRLFYAENLHGQFAVLSFFVGQSEEAASDREFLKDTLGLEGLDSVLFALHRPPWRRKGGDPRFWNAEGDVQQFLSKLMSESMAPLRSSYRPLGRARGSQPIPSLYLFLPDSASLNRVYEAYGDQYKFFTALESTHLSLLLREVRARVIMRGTEDLGAITYRDLSEGEQQLLLVLGLLKFTARDETLFLLDEPDTHLNPAWSTRYLEFLDRFIRERSSCHILMSTHDPLVFAGLTRSQVRVFTASTGGAARATTPVEDPQGMGIQAILGSELFRLRDAGLDQVTVGRLRRQQQLAAKPSLTPEEEEELGSLTATLTDDRFWKADSDPTYQLFLERFLPVWLSRLRDAELDGTNAQLTPDEAARRDAILDELVDELGRDLQSRDGGSA